MADLIARFDANALAEHVLEVLEHSPAARQRLRELLDAPAASAAAYTPRTLAGELGRSERSVRAAIARGELAAVKRGRGWVISAEAVARWAHSESIRGDSRVPVRRPARPTARSGPGPMARALKGR